MGGQGPNQQTNNRATNNPNPNTQNQPFNLGNLFGGMMCGMSMRPQNPQQGNNPPTMNLGNLGNLANMFNQNSTANRS